MCLVRPGFDSRKGLHGSARTPGGRVVFVNCDRFDEAVQTANAMLLDMGYRGGANDRLDRA